jgi:2-hydroxy-4-carboxymuconate semialdehyde hemiacetal dehydrogenase
MTNICMVGTGAIATQHMKAFKKLGGISQRWVISRREKAARDFAQQWQVDRSGAELDVALRDPAVDLVVITSPSDLHAEQTIRSLRAGKDVIVEIPVALSLADTERIIDLAEKLQRRVMVCHTMRSFPGIREVRRRVQAGELHLTHIVGDFAIPRRHNQGMSGQPRNWIDNLLWHHGCHMVDVSMWVLGVTRVEHVSAMLGSPHGQLGMIMDASVHFRTRGRQLVSHTLTYNTEQFCWEVRFTGCEGTFVYKNGQLLDENGEQVMQGSSWVDLVLQDKEMLESIAHGAPSEYDIASVLAPMRVLHQAEVSAAT